MLGGVVAAGVMAVLVAVPAAASTSVARAKLPGGAVPQVAVSEAVSDTPADAQQTSVVFLKPRNAALLAQLAARGSSATPLTPAELEAKFVPSAADIARVTGYLESQGLHVTGRHLLSLSVTGTTSAQEHAFDVNLGVYRSAAGTTFKAPSASPQLPVSIAPLVQAVGGLDSSMKMPHASTGSGAAQPATVNPSCSGANQAHNAYSGSLLPAELAGTGGYNYNALINGGDDGSNESIAFIEFSNYPPADISTYQSCFPAITSPAARQQARARRHPDADRRRRGRARHRDRHVGRARRAHLRVHGAEQRRLRRRHDQRDRGRSGLHPRAHRERLVGAVRAGDVGLDHRAPRTPRCSSPRPPGCRCTSRPATTDRRGATATARRDRGGGPASSRLPPPSGEPGCAPPPRNEVTWREGGGGVSMYFPKPRSRSDRTRDGRQRRQAVPEPGGQCRQIPDISLNASPNTGYLIYCTVNASACGGLTGWLPDRRHLGLSAADGRHHRRHQRVLAGPRRRPARFREPVPVRVGTKSRAASTTSQAVGTDIHGGSLQRRPGLRHGYRSRLGQRDVARPDARQQWIAGHEPAPLQQAHVATPLDNKSFVYGQRITFSGTLTDTTTSTPIAKALITIVIGSTKLRLTTNANGAWAVARPPGQAEHDVARVYTGSAGHRAARERRLES